MKQLILITLMLCTLCAGAKDKKDIDPPLSRPNQGGLVGFLKGDFYGTAPLCMNQEMSITTHYYNISQSPLRLQGISKFDYNPGDLLVTVAKKEVTSEHVYGRWGPPEYEKKDGNRLYLNMNGWSLEDKLKVHVSGIDFEKRFDRSFRFPKRDLVLFHHEGYARKYTFMPNWVGKDEKKQMPPWIKFVVLSDTFFLDVSAPKLLPEACQPGKPIIWGTAQNICGLGDTLYPFKAKLPKPKPSTFISDPKSGLILELEPPLKLEDDKGFRMAYIIGNTGKEPILVEQNSMVPPVASWNLTRFKKEQSKGDGQDKRILLDLYPAREAFLLLPGEYLSFRTNFSSGELKWKNGRDYELSWILPEVKYKRKGAKEFSTTKLEAAVSLKPRAPKK